MKSLSSSLFTFLLLLFLTPTPTLSSPAPSPQGSTWTDDHHHPDCLSDADATHLTDVLVSISVKFDPAYVTQFLTDDFSLQSDSLNWVFGIPAGEVFTTDKNILLAGAYNLTQSEPPQPPIVVSFVMHSCTDIAYRSVSVEDTPVQGIHVIRARKEGGIWKAYLSWDEFNSAADLFALGVSGCKSPFAPS